MEFPEDATRKAGVSTEEQEDGTDQPVLSERDQAMQEIEEQLSAQSPATDASAEAPAEKKAEAPETTDEQPQVVDDPKRYKVRVKVGEREEEKSLDDVLNDLRTANGRLRVSAQREKELEARQKELDEREKKLAPPSAEAETGDADVDAQIKAAMSALVDGDEDAAAEALKSVLKGRRNDPATPQVIDEEAILAKAEQRIEAKRLAEENAKAWGEFVGTSPAFADKTSKERQYGDYLFETKYGPQIAAGEISYREALTKAAEDVTAVFQPQKEQQPSSRQQKEERKKAIDNLPVAGARAVRQPEEVETTDDVLAEMRKMRGQPV